MTIKPRFGVFHEKKAYGLCRPLSSVPGLWYLSSKISEDDGGGDNGDADGDDSDGDGVDAD